MDGGVFERFAKVGEVVGRFYNSNCHIFQLNRSRGTAWRSGPKILSALDIYPSPHFFLLPVNSLLSLWFAWKNTSTASSVIGWQTSILFPFNDECFKILLIKEIVSMHDCFPTLHSSDSQLSVSLHHLDLNTDYVYPQTLAQHGVFDALIPHAIQTQVWDTIYSLSLSLILADSCMNDLGHPIGVKSCLH